MLMFFESPGERRSTNGARRTVSWGPCRCLLNSEPYVKQSFVYTTLRIPASLALVWFDLDEKKKSQYRVWWREGERERKRDQPVATCGGFVSFKSYSARSICSWGVIWNDEYVLMLFFSFSVAFLDWLAFEANGLSVYEVLCTEYIGPKTKVRSILSMCQCQCQCQLSGLIRSKSIPTRKEVKILDPVHNPCLSPTTVETYLISTRRVFNW